MIAKPAHGGTTTLWGRWFRDPLLRIIAFFLYQHFDCIDQSNAPASVSTSAHAFLEIRERTRTLSHEQVRKHVFLQAFAGACLGKDVYNSRCMHDTMHQHSYHLNAQTYETSKRREVNSAARCSTSSKRASTADHPSTAEAIRCFRLLLDPSLLRLLPDPPAFCKTGGSSSRASAEWDVRDL